MAETNRMQFGILSWAGPGNHILDGVQMPHGKGQIWGVWPSDCCGPDLSWMN